MKRDFKKKYKHSAGNALERAVPIAHPSGHVAGFQPVLGGILHTILFISLQVHWFFPILRIDQRGNVFTCRKFKYFYESKCP